MTAVSLPATTRVVACADGGRTRVEERALRAPAPDELLLRLRVVGFCGTDLFKLDNATAAPGTVLGHELVGEVLAAGAGAPEFRPGDRVAVPHHVACGTCAMCRRGNETMCATFRENLLEPGGFSEHVIVRARAAAHAARRVPAAVSDDAAVFMEPAACVLRGVERSGLGEEGVAVVLGAGSMGLLHALVIAAVRPRVAVAVLDPLAERRARARALGAVALEPGPAAREEVAALGRGLGADAVFDTVGGPRPLADALALTREGGTVVLFAHAPAGARADFDINDLFKHERRVLGTYSGGLGEQARIFALLADGRFDPTPLVTHRLPLEAFDEGVALVRRRAALKVLFTP